MRLLMRLEQSSRGKVAIERALKFWEVKKPSQLKPFIVLSDVSKTDAVISRSLDPKTQNEIKKREVRVLLRSDLAEEDLLLDLAHELAHAVEPPQWDPYDPELSPARYMAQSLEGAGGEIEAVYQECVVARELKLSNEKLRCDRYLKENYKNGSQQVSLVQISQDFYRVGEHYSEVLDALGSSAAEFKYLSSDDPVLISSTGQAPYPVALLAEYQELTETACANSRNRLKSISGRSIASSQAARLIARRCTTQNHER